jgi:hypothetical protein
VRFNVVCFQFFVIFHSVLNLLNIKIENSCDRTYQKIFRNTFIDGSSCCSLASYSSSSLNYALHFKLSLCTLFCAMKFLASLLKKSCCFLIDTVRQKLTIFYSVKCTLYFTVWRTWFHTFSHLHLTKFRLICYRNK